MVNPLQSTRKTPLWKDSCEQGDIGRRAILGRDAICAAAVGFGFRQRRNPRQLLTDEVFLAKVRMKNVGSIDWAGENQPVLYSVDPEYNKTWGTRTVEKRPPAPASPRPVQATSGKRVLTLDNCEYVGSFKVPPRVGEGGVGFSESGLALRTMKDGTKRLFASSTVTLVNPARVTDVGVPKVNLNTF